MQKFTLPIGWTIKTWCNAMKACNQAKFTPLAKMTPEQRQAMADKYEALTSQVQPEDYDTITSEGLPSTRK